MITQQELQQKFNYNPNTGDFTYKKDCKYNMLIKQGTVAGTWDSWGHVQIKINRKLYLAHRLVWLFTFGVWPELTIDHINGIRNDNRLKNLRHVSKAENNKNTNKARLKLIGIHK